MLPRVSEDLSNPRHNNEAGPMIERALRAEPTAISPTEGRYQIATNEFVSCDWCAIFNTSEFFNLHKNGRAFYFQLCLGNPRESAGVVHFTESEPGSFRSPRRGTFGGFEFNRALRMELIEWFVDEVEQALKENGARQIELLEPPSNFDACNAGLNRRVRGID